MEYITRQEKYLAYLAQLKTGTLPAPQTREEIYLAAIAGLYKKPLPYPQTRVETYLKAIADGKTTGLPDPKTRKEYYLYAIATGDTQRYIPTPITREEQLLDKVVNILVGVENVTVSGNGSAMLYNAAKHGFTGLTLYGKSTQMNTTGANLLPFEVGQKSDTFEVFTDGIQIDIKKGGDIYIIGTVGNTTESSYYESPLLTAGEYYIYSDTPEVYLYVVAWRNGTNITLGHSINGVATKIKVNDGDKFRIFLRITKIFNGKIKPMITRTQMDSSSYEPYTGCKPSPSPDFPQEIKSVGDTGAIDIEALGKNLIPFPYPLLGGAGTQIERNGVKYTVQSDGGIRCVGTPTAVSYVNLSRIRFSDATLIDTHMTDGKIVLSGEKITYDSNNNALFIYIRSDQVGVPIDTVIYPQIELGTVATSYEPYKPAQTLIIPTPNGLPGIPVSSGGNYTDSDGQQWVCDEIDFKKGVYVQRVATEMPKAQWTLLEETADVPNRYRIKGALAHKYSSGSVRCLVSHGIHINWAVTSGWALNGDSFFYHPEEDTTVEKAEEQIYGFINSANPLTFLGQLETPIETPLTTEQLAEYKMLRTYSPTTTVINDAEADMKITYRCNLKKTESELEALYADTEREFKAIAETEDKKNEQNSGIV